jgi:hypothetical protein
MAEDAPTKSFPVPHIIVAVLIIVVIAVLFWWPEQEYKPKPKPIVTPPVQTVIEPEPIAEPEPEVEIEPEVVEAIVQEPEPVATVELTEPEAIVEPEIVIVEEAAEEPIELPLRDDSWLMTQLQQQIANKAALMLIEQKDLIANFVVFVDNSVGGGFNRQFSPVKAPKSAFSADQIAMDDKLGALYHNSLASQRRYEPYVALFQAMPTRTMVEMYRALQPEIQHAYEQLGYSEFDFDKKLLKLIDRLVRLPVSPEPAELYSESVNYKYVDEQFESLSGIEKLLLRMGPKNQAAVQAKLRWFRNELSK